MTVHVLDDAGLRGPLSPLRRRLLSELREPGSATGLAARLGQTRQRINYHLRELEKAGLVELVEVRQRRGREERLLRATPRTVVVTPAIVGPRTVADQDRFAVDTLLTASARTLDTVARQRTAAAATDKRLVTFTIEAEIGFERPADIEDFASRLAALIAGYDRPAAPRRYRVVVGGHPSSEEHS
ncbi:MAG TPA: helix-turn-helix domain-containing protein [Actinoplanes sp.]|nr:helix-turn-helix domain-containing protein [Actinoplanes sp.]